MNRYLTVVYTINDTEAFEPTREMIQEQFKPSANEPFAITAMSVDHEIRRLELIEQAAEECDDIHELREMIETIAGHLKIGDVKNLEQLRGGS